MDYLMPLLAVVVIGVAAFSLAGRLGRRAHPEAASELPREVGVPRAQEAASLLDEPAHRAVYGAIAQGDVMGAVRAYRRHTGRSLRDAVTDVQSLAAHPQIWRPAEVESLPDDGGPVAVTGGGPAKGSHPAPVPEAVEGDDVAAPGERPPSAAAGPDDHEPLLFPAEWSAEPAPEMPAFDVEVQREAETVRVSSRELPPWLRDQLAAMVRDGNLESAAVQLSGHTALTVPEAFELLRRLREEHRGH